MFPLSKIIFPFVLLAGASSFSMAQSFGQSSVPTAQARTPLNVQTGRIIDIQRIQIEVPATATSNVLGGAIGAAGGAYAGRNSGWQAQSVLGLIGAAVGRQVADSVSREMRDAEQIIVSFSAGQATAYIQESSDGLYVGQNVYVIGQYPAVRVMPAH